MDKTTRTEYRRIYLIEDLPEPLTRADRHLQFFDNYIANTRMRIRSIRVPETKAWEWILQQRVWSNESKNLACEIAEIRLNEAEHTQFELFEGSEIRKNRYFLTLGGREFEFDVYLGGLWGLNRASVRFEDPDDAESFKSPGGEFLDVSGNLFFRDENLVNMKFADVQEAVAAMMQSENAASVN